MRVIKLTVWNNYKDLTVFDFFFSVLGAVFGTVVKTVAAVVTSIFTNRANSTATKRDNLNYIQKMSEIRDGWFDELHETNQELEHLKGKQYKNTQEINRITFLQEQREEYKNNANEIREEIAKETFLLNQHTTENIIITKDNYHILQWNAFADVISKTCPSCSRKMKIQWPAGSKDLDFFWGCTGYYHKPQCRKKINLNQNELRILVDVSSPEHSITTEELDIFIDLPETALDIHTRVQDLISDKRSKKESVNIVCCPTHGEPMLLSKKINVTGGFLDTYHLKCPHYVVGCGYIEKLKSAGQLAALLKHETGSGIL